MLFHTSQRSFLLNKIITNFLNYKTKSVVCVCVCIYRLEVIH